MCLANPLYHPCSHTSIEWFHCPAKEANLDEACMNVNFLRGDPTPETCPLKSCKFPGMEKGWVCCHCQGGPNFTGWCTMPSVRSNTAFEVPWSDIGSSTCDHGCCKRCVRVKGKHQLPYSTRNTVQNPTTTCQVGWDSSSSSSGSSSWGSSSSDNSRNSSPPSSTDGSYTGYLGPPDARLREFYDKYVPHGSSMSAAGEPSWAGLPESSTNGFLNGVPVEQIPVQSVTVQKKRKGKEKGTESRSKKSKSSSRSHRSKR